ncbi:hypothetical protein EG329_000834 [Mollisiaceae sp. DMI_Dod_QoI]|nr:hypothetical protein EG329_000834 [Helotiales sp. DMI_Dod_QoI]
MGSRSQRTDLLARSVTSKDTLIALTKKIQTVEISSKPEIPRGPCKNLVDLPTEMVESIVAFLPTSSAAALALVSHPLLNTLSTKYFKQSKVGKTAPTGKPQVEERLNFLRLLEKDFPNKVICFDCYTLHDPFISEEKSFRERCNHKCQDSSAASGTKELKFYWVQLALKHHRLGLNMKQHLARLQLAFSMGWNQQRFQTRSEARIVSVDTSNGSTNRLYFRSQYRVRTPSYPGDLNEPRFEFDFCVHSSGHHITDAMAILLSDLSPHAEKRQTWSCAYCATEFEVEAIEAIIDFRHKLEFTITVWQDFGSGDALDSPLWLNHFERNEWRLLLNRRNFIAEEVGVLKTRFESAPGRK